MKTAVIFICIGIFGCSSSGGPNAPKPGETDAGQSNNGVSGDDASPEVEVKGIETLGKQCYVACGSADDRKCALPHEACKSDLCIVDPAHDLLTYCTVDCTSQPCPEGWDCEEIEAFNDTVTHGCVAQPASCGDGIVQLGEVCDGDSPELGQCVGCQSWKARCGDKVVQQGEVCDGDTAETYCLGCTQKLTPYIQFEGDGLRLIAADEVSGSMISYMSAGFGTEDARFELPTAGDANGCGRVEVVEVTAELTRVRWTLCNEDGDRGTFTMAFPRTQLELDDWNQAIPEKWAVSADLQNADGSVKTTWTMADLDRFRIDTYKYATDPADNHTRGWYEIRLEKDSPVSPFTQETAEIDLDKVEIYHPPLPN